jgi:hypothetical protein
MSAPHSVTLALSVLLLIGASAPVAGAQDPKPVGTALTVPPVQGSVVNATRNTLVVRAGDQYVLFELTSDTTRPVTIPAGATVRVAAEPAEGNAARRAVWVAIVGAPPAAAEPKEGEASAAPPPEEADQTSPVPPSVRRLEQELVRQTRRYRAGVRTGVGLDPEIVMLGGQIQLGPFFSERVWARPNLELGFGEVTDLFALNFEGIYRLPVTTATQRWSVFIGGGPALNFTKLGFDRTTEETGDPEDDFSFDDFELDVGFNIVAGVQTRGGMFIEIKSSAYSTPSLRFAVGYNF